MKKLKLHSLVASLFLLSGTLFAEVNFSGMAGGTIGVAGDIAPSPSFGMPFNAFAAVQFNFDSWGILRANMGLATGNLAGQNLFTGQDAVIKMNELSLVLIKNSTTLKHYFGFYFGTYETVGKDEFMQRQFGIEPYTSLLTKNATTLSTGITAYENQGLGFSYVTNFSKTPAAFGVNLYLNLANPGAPQFNLDLRTAFTTNYITMDFAVGVSSPLLNNHAGEDVVLLIDTVYVHSGLSVLLGNIYTHSLFIQAGIQNMALGKDILSSGFNPKNDFTLLVEPRIYTKNVKYRITAYSIPKSKISEMMYLTDTLGGCITVFSDTIPAKANNMTVGGHLIASFSDSSLFEIMNATTLPQLNAYLTPFLNIPVANGTMEIMAQIGVCNILDTISFKYQAKVGYKKAF